MREVREFRLGLAETLANNATAVSSTGTAVGLGSHVPVIPHMSYMNELYVYPESINFNNYHNGSISCRNIALDFKLMDNDFNVQAQGLQVSNTTMCVCMYAYIWYVHVHTYNIIPCVNAQTHTYIKQQ